MKLKSKVRSHAFLLIPLSITLYHNLFIYAALIAGVTIFSTLYHFSDEKKYGILDKIFAYGVIGYNLYICYLSDFKQPYFALALISIAIGFYFFFWKKKDDYERHIACAIITTLCIL